MFREDIVLALIEETLRGASRGVVRKALCIPNSREGETAKAIDGHVKAQRISVIIDQASKGNGSQ